ncbi:hypothetical protein [Aquimarina sp. AD10]|uniref:hypothetical protein n=1 Tax=Aquimarina sp. AD10 TaxID=1714849 RepID=UPI0011C3D400|nr:hypothetical protein [Aquimarina sp. AD10]
MYLLIFIINGFFENYLIQSQIIPYILAALFLVTTIALYFIDIINSNTVLHVKSSLLFWISVGLLLYYISNLPFRIIRNYYTELADSSTMILVGFISTVVMNTCFCIGYVLQDNVSSSK